MRLSLWARMRCAGGGADEDWVDGDLRSGMEKSEARGRGQE